MSDNKRILQMVDRVSVEDSIVDLFRATDAKDWDRVRLAFAKEVELDMSSLTGEDKKVMTPGDIAGTWAEGLADVTEVFHQVSNFHVELEIYTATASCHGVALHFRPDAEKQITEIVGTYDFNLVRSDRRWRINSFRFNKKFVVTR